MVRQVCAFTDTYLPTLNGVTYTVKAWRERWQANGGSMPVVFPGSSGYDPGEGEHPVSSVSFPFYDGYRLGVPTIPDGLEGADLVHAHTPFSLGLAALRMVRSGEQPFIASYHTPAGEYTSYLAPLDPLARALSSVSTRYERWFLNHADAVVAPSQTTRRYLLDEVGVETPVHIVSNGVDLERFSPRDGATFRERFDLPPGPLIGYTGRHGYEKRLTDLLVAIAAGPADWSVAFAGEGPATEQLRREAETLGVDARFLGVLDRDDLPAFYSALDVFAFPSPVETQGLVALEAMACGTPVVGVDEGALSETIDDGVTGIHYPAGDVDAFVDALERGLAGRSRLAEGCLEVREEFGLGRSIQTLSTVYDGVSAD